MAWQAHDQLIVRLESAAEDILFDILKANDVNHLNCLMGNILKI